MPKMIFVNLPVADLPRATAFYEAIGATRNPRFSDGTAACLVFSETICAMLLTHEKFMHFSPKPIADKGTTEVLFCLSEESREAVYGMPYSEWKAKHQTEASPEQQAGFAKAQETH